MSDIQMRELALACAPRIAAKIEAFVLQTVRDDLAVTIEAVLREKYPGERLRIYISKKPATARRERDNAIRTKFTGRNTSALAEEFGLSIKQTHRIATGKH